MSKELYEDSKNEQVCLKATMKQFVYRNRRHMCNKLSINVDDVDEVFVLGPLHDEMMEDHMWMPFLYSNNNNFNKGF